MKLMKTTLFAVAAMAAVSCVKENIQENSSAEVNANLVELTIIAGTENDETKAAFSEDAYPQIVWQGNEEISVLGASTGNQKFTTTSTGKKAEFNGLADLSDNVLYAVYPHDATITLTNDGKLSNVTVPAVQTATAGSFDPKAYIAVAKSTDKNLTFKAVGGFVKFKLEDATNVKSVTMVSNAGANMACTATVAFNDNGSVSHGSPYVADTESTSVKLEGTFETGKEYFMVVRPQPYTGGITLYIEYADGTVLSRTSESALFESGKGRNYIRNLGTLKKADFNEVNNAYTLYLMGYDITVGNITINQATHGAATLITNSSSNKTLENNGVYFIDSAAEGVIMKDAGKLIVLSADEKMATVTKSGQAAVTVTDGEDYFIMQNIKFVTGLTSGNMFGGGKSDNAFETIYFENCKFEVPKDMNFMYAQLPINEFIMTNCDIKVYASKNAKAILQTNTSSTYKKVIFRNNIFYCTNGDAVYTMFKNKAATISNTEFNNNTLASVYPAGGSNGSYITAKILTKADGLSNLIYNPNYTEMTGDQYSAILESENTEGQDITIKYNLVQYGDAAPTKKFKPHLNLAASDKIVAPYIKITSNGEPFATKDFANGIFIPIETYKAYGAKR